MSAQRNQLKLVSPAVSKKSSYKRRRAEREAIPHTTGWVYDVLGVEVASSKTKLYKVSWCQMKMVGTGRGAKWCIINPYASIVRDRKKVCTWVEDKYLSARK